MPSLLHFGDTGLGFAYFAFVFFTALGVLQIVAVQERLVGLSLMSAYLPTEAGRVLGVSLIAGTSVWFFTSQWSLILEPGLAGAELSLTFAGGVFSALCISLIGASIFHARHALAGEPETDFGQALQRWLTLTPDGLQGWLFIPTTRNDPRLGICLVPNPASKLKELNQFVKTLAEYGIVALVIDWGTAFTPYSEAKAAVLAAHKRLSELSNLTGECVTVIGCDVADNLVLRVSNNDPEMPTEIALRPLVEAMLDRGLELLQETTYWQAMRRRFVGIGHQLLQQPNTSDGLEKLADWPVLILYSTRGSAVMPDKSQMLCDYEVDSRVIILTVADLAMSAKTSAACLIASWLEEHK
jgi:hypothetical protein